MNNYSLLEQVLHRYALSSKSLCKLIYNIESFFFSKSFDEYPDNHVFISGLPRSGTTALLNAIYKSQLFASLKYQDMPFVLSPNLWAIFNNRKVENTFYPRAHNDGLMISVNSPEAFEEVFWKTFQNSSELFEKFRCFVNLIIFKNNKKRYLSKNNKNALRIGTIKKIFPNSKILITYRNPLQHSYSLLFQHNHFINLQKKDKFLLDYMGWLGHNDFGLNYLPNKSKNVTYKNKYDLNHWLEQWLYFYENILLLKKEKNVILVCYENICNERVIWDELQKIIGVKNLYSFRFKESKKKIKDSYNHDLLKKCMLVYKNLNRVKVKDCS